MTESKRAGALLEHLLSPDGGVLRELVDDDDRVPDDAEVLTYAEVGRRYEQIDDEAVEDPPDLSIAAAVVTGSSTRRNHREERTLVVEVEVSARMTLVRERGTLVITDVLDAVSDALTRHSEDFTAEGESGGVDVPMPDEDRNRYLGVRRYDFERID